MKILPKAKLENIVVTDNIVVRNLKDETLIYNLTTNQAFCLNDTSAKVFNACDGKTSFDDLKEKHQLTDEIIYLALDGLQKENLIEADYVSPFASLSRREVIRKVGLASMIALPVVSTLVAPSAASAASGLAALGQPCTRAVDNSPRRGNCDNPFAVCAGNPGICRLRGNCVCSSPNDCLTEAFCSTSPCNEFNVCAP